MRNYETLIRTTPYSHNLKVPLFALSSTAYSHSFHSLIRIHLNPVLLLILVYCAITLICFISFSFIFYFTRRKSSCSQSFGRSLSPCSNPDPHLCIFASPISTLLEGTILAKWRQTNESQREKNRQNTLEKTTHKILKHNTQL